MIGVTGSLPIAPNKLYLDVRALGGFTYVHSPEIKATGVEEGEEDLFIIISDHNTLSWALDFGAGFRYNRSRKQYFTLYADYLMANPQYDSMEYNSSVGPERLDSFSQRVSAVNITLGIGYIVN